jgi:hypothetical protein
LTVADEICCFHRRSSSICNLSVHKILALKNIPSEGEIPEPGKMLWYLQENKPDAKPF